MSEFDDGRPKFEVIEGGLQAHGDLIAELGELLDSDEPSLLQTRRIYRKLEKAGVFGEPTVKVPIEGLDHEISIQLPLGQAPSVADIYIARIMDAVFSEQEGKPFELPEKPGSLKADASADPDNVVRLFPVEGVFSGLVDLAPETLANQFRELFIRPDQSQDSE